MRIIHCSEMSTNKGKSLRRGSKTLSMYKTYPSILFPIAVVNLRDLCSGLDLFVAIGPAGRHFSHLFSAQFTSMNRVSPCDRI